MLVMAELLLQMRRTGDEDGGERNTCLHEQNISSSSQRCRKVWACVVERGRRVALMQELNGGLFLLPCNVKPKPD